MKNISRRNFIKNTSAFGLLASSIQFLPSKILAKDAIAPSNRINIACFGTGVAAKGHLNFAAMSPRTQVMAMCDVRQSSLKEAEVFVNTKAKENTQVPYRAVDIYEDYQEILDRDDIDAVWISTPDHWHVQMAVAALLKDKAVYVETPMSLTVEEGRILADTVAKTRGVLQVGSQQRSMEQFRIAAQLVRNGYLGKIKRIDTFLGKTEPFPKNLREEPIPAGFNYDKWLGHTPWKPYNAEKVKSKKGAGWRAFYAYSGRKDGDWGSHHYDIIQWALDKDDSGASEFFPEGYDGEALRRYKYSSGETVYVNPNLGDTGEESIKFIGEDAEISVSRKMITCTKPHLIHQAVQTKDKWLQISKDHRLDFLDAISYGHKNIAPAETGHRTATICHLMSLARRNNEYIKWDAKKEEVIVGSDATKLMLSRPRRAPYFIGA